jgi:hypothetical protein
MKTSEEISELAKQNDRKGYERNCFIDGYTQCQEDNSDKKYTEEDLRKAILLSATSDTDFIPDRCNEIIQLLNKQD